MPMRCLSEHLNRYVELTASEREALDGLAVGARSYRKGALIRAEHGNSGDIFVVTKGWIYCAVVLEDGRRQILKLHFRGDLLGLDGLAFADATDSIHALTDADVCVVDRVALGKLFAEHPRLAALLFAVQQIDRITLTERLVSLGRSSAKGRVAALLMWIASRLRHAGEKVEDGFLLPLTQEEIGDLTGLTAVHVNRTLRVLVEQALIARSGATFTILDMDRLARIANFSERTERIDRAWLPSEA